MLKQTFTGLIALLATSAAAQAQSAAPPPAPGQAQSCPAPKIAGTAMDLKQVPGTNLMTVPVTIDGTPLQFLLDIGNNPDQVSDAARGRLGLPQVAQTSASNAMAGLNTPFQFQGAFYNVKSANGAVSYQTRVRISAFAVAGATVQNLEMLVANDRDMGKSEPYDGLFTANLFPQYDINFDFGAKRLSFMTSTNCTDPNQVAYWPHQVVAVVPMTIKDDKIVVPVKIEGHDVEAVIDTSFDHTVVRRGFADETLDLGDKDMTPDGDRRDGMGQQIYVHTFPQISFGGIVAQNVPARIQSYSMVHPIDRTPTLGSRASFASDPATRIADFTIGMDVLHQLHIYAAFGENELYVTPAQ